MGNLFMVKFIDYLLLDPAVVEERALDFPENDANGTAHDFPSREVPWHYDAIFSVIQILYLLMIIFTFVSNILVILCVIKTKSLQTVTNIYIVSLAVADVGVAIFVMPFGMYIILVEASWELVISACKVFLSMETVFVSASVWNLCGIAYDRYLAVSDPLGYSRGGRQIKTIVIICVLWLMAFGLIPVLLVNNDFSRDTYQCVTTDSPFLLIWAVGTFYLPIVCLSIFYTYIYLKVRQSVMRINSDDGRRKENRITMIMAIVIGSFVLCWLPVRFIDSISRFCSQPGCGINNRILGFMQTLAYANSTFNPIIYTIFNGEFRNAAKKLLGIKADTAVTSQGESSASKATAISMSTRS
ncbi:Beta-1 adrenergic receptor [Halotydeus destructor]|nr:Beta-1 adrenergic receptor [Halotydeus destructor]